MNKYSLNILYETSHGNPHCCGYVRLLLPLHHPSIRNNYTIIHDRTLKTPTNIIIGERIFMQDLRSVSNLLQHVKETNTCFIYTIDDNLLDLQRINSNYGAYYKDVISMLSKNAKGLIVSTNALANRFKEFNSNIFVVENALDETLIPVKYVAPDPISDIITIGYMGTFTHDKDFNIILPALQHVLNKYPNVYFEIAGAISHSKLNLPRYSILEIKKESYIYPKFWEWMSKNIRWDIGIAPLEDSAFTNCKCLVGDTLVPTPQGIKTLKDIVLNNYTKINIGENHYNVKKWFVYKNKTTIRITTKKGYEICGTLNHKINITDNIEIPLNNLVLGDKIPIVPFDFLQEEYQYISYPMLLTKKITPEILNSCDSLSIPRIIINETWGRLLGYLFGDGYMGGFNRVSITSSTDYPDIIEDIKHLFKSIGLNPVLSFKKNKNKKIGKGVAIIAPSRTLRLICEQTGFTGKNGKVFRVPKIILNSPQSVIKEFLKALFESDAGVDESGLTYVTKSEKFAREIQFLLLGFKISSTVHNRWNTTYKKYYWSVRLVKEESILFHKKIGFISIKKNKKLNSIVNRKSHNHTNFLWEDEIVAISKEINDVFDIEVENRHHYIANGFMSHNSDIKFLDYSALGIAGVFSDITAYNTTVQHSVTGLLAKNTVEDWIKCLEALIINQSMRLQIAQNAQNYLVTHRTLDSCAIKWFNAIQDIYRGVRT